MGDERTNPDPSRSRRPGSTDGSPKPNPKLDRFWKAMIQMFGTRWVTSYGQTPSELWTLGIETLTAKELKCAYRALLADASAHPPTLPEFLAFARQDSGKKPSRFPDPGTPEWEDARRDVMAKIAKQSKDRGVVFPAPETSDERLARLRIENEPPPVNRENHVIAPQFVPPGHAYLAEWRRFCVGTPVGSWPAWLRADPVAAQWKDHY